jgi:hypothetical protein
MAHCPFEKLGDLRDVLDEIRAWPGIEEPKPGIFHLKRVAFLHFHLYPDGRRRADVRDGAAWGEPLDVPLPASVGARRRLLAEARRRHATTTSHLAGPRKRPAAR